MSKEWGKYYMENINRLTKDYFYSVNRKNSSDSIWSGYGHYSYKIDGKWIALIYKSSPSWHLEFLGKKINEN